MAKELLSDRQIVTAKPTNKEYLLADGSGLFLRVRPTNAKDWFFHYTHSSKRNKLSIGQYPDTSLANARLKAVTLRETLATGIDPKQKAIDDALAAEAAIRARELAIAAEANKYTVNRLFNHWEKLALCDRKDKGKEVRRMFEKDVLPVIGSMSVEDVRKSHIVNIITEYSAWSIQQPPHWTLVEGSYWPQSGFIAEKNMRAIYMRCELSQK